MGGRGHASTMARAECHTLRSPTQMPPRLTPAIDELALLTLRQRPALTPFSSQDDRMLTRDWGHLPVEVIAHRRGLSLSAVLYRARRIGLRCASRNWPCHQVEAWLCIMPSAWAKLSEEGLDWWPLTDRRGRVLERMVSTTSLARWLVQGNRWQRLVAREGADEFFCREILESAAELQHASRPASERIDEPFGEPPLRWEYCKFLGPDHVCRNPFATCHTLFCSNSERYAAGDDPKCESRRLPLPANGDPLRPASAGSLIGGGGAGF